MMFRWLMQLFGAPGAAPRLPESRREAAGVAPSAPRVPFAGQQLPLVGRNGQVAGFELRPTGALTLQSVAAPSAPMDAVQQQLALLETARGILASGRSALIVLPVLALARSEVVQQVPEGVMLLPHGDVSGQAPASRAGAQALATLRERGVLVGALDGPPSPGAAIDFVLLRDVSGDVDTLLLSMQRWQEVRRGLKFVAVGLESLEDIERVLGAGVSLARGRFRSRAAHEIAKPLQPAAHRICAMLNELLLDRDTAAVARAVRADVTLSYRLLRYANSPAIGLSRGLDSVEQAVTVLGRAELTRWLSVLLMSSAAGRQASAALQEHALARGRMLENVARRLGVPGPEVGFTVGMMSRLDELLEMPLAAAIRPLRLPDEVSAALLQRRGPWAPYLGLADGIESDDEAGFMRECEAFGGLEAVLADAEQAWAWAAQVQAGMKA